MLSRCPVLGCPLNDPVWVGLLVGVSSRGCSMRAMCGRGLVNSGISLIIVSLVFPY